MMLYEHMGMKKTAMEWLNYWIAEREEVRRKKESIGPNGYTKPPFSQDPIFQTTYFCNVRREDDKVTRWIRQNWTLQTITPSDYDYAMVLARFINNIPCLEALSQIGKHPNGTLNLNFYSVEDVLVQRAFNGDQVWGGAYVVTSHGLAMPKAAYLCQRVLPMAYEVLARSPVAARYLPSPPTLAQHHGLLMQLEGLGSFMAAQVIADLKNTEGHPLMQALDWGEWSAHGPGSLRGLEWIYGKKVSPSKFKGAIAWVASQLTAENFRSLQTTGYFNMQDLQNCLCEFDKFMRVMTKTGKSKRKYDGR